MPARARSPTQFGDFLAIDFSNPASPKLASSLTNTLGTPNGGANNINGGAAVSSSLAYLVGSTSTGSATQTGSGQLQVVNIANPASPSVTDTLTIPGTFKRSPWPFKETRPWSSAARGAGRARSTMRRTV